MIKSPINMESVFKRNMCLSDSREYDQSGYMNYIAATDAIQRKLSTKFVKEAVDTMIKENSTKANANKEGYKYCINILESLENNTEYNCLTEGVFQSFVTNIIPYCESVTSVREYATRKKLPENYTNQLSVLESNYKLYDRIKNNHTMISKRFKLDDLFLNHQVSLESVCRKVCEMIDTYNQSPHVKMELCFEELCYLYNKNATKMNEPLMVETVTDYFLSLPVEEGTTVTSLYRKMINESKVLSLNADKRVKYLMNDYEDFLYGSDTIKDYINQYKLRSEKSIKSFGEFIDDVYNQPIANVVMNTKSILKMLRYYYLFSSIYVDNGIIDIITHKYIEKDINKKDLDTVMQHLENERNYIQQKIDYSDVPYPDNRLNDYYNELTAGIQKLNEYADTLYSEDEMENKSDIDINESSYILEKTNKVIVNNLIQDSIDADKFITSLAKQTLETNDAILTDEKDTLDEGTLLKHIDPEGRISAVLCSYDIRSCKLSDVYESADSIIKSTNNMLRNTNGKVYYTMMENCIDFVFRSKFTVVTNLKEDAVKSNSMADVEIMRVSTIAEAATLMESLQNLNPDKIVDKAIKKIGDMSTEQASMFIESWGFGAPIEKEEMERFVTNFSNYQNECGNYVDAFNIQKVFKSTVHNENNDPSIIVESTKIMGDIVSEAVDLNSLKLAIMGFKKKAKTLSAKEQQMSRDLDMGFNNFIKSVQGFYKVTDHREQIIKGQVFPSLSKIIKIGIALAGLGVASGGIVLPAIAVASGLALSKNASDKERKLILDEIDIELQVVDREIKRAEDGSKGSRKYRTLLTYQKNLQREKQRIVYHLARKGKGIPISSTKGIKRGGNDD